MFKKIEILLWKEINYRSALATLLGISIPVLIIILININELTIKTYIRSKDSYKISENIEKDPLPPDQLEPYYEYDKNLRAYSKYDDEGDFIYAYEPSNYFLERLLNYTTGLEHRYDSSYYIRAGLDDDFSFGIRFFGINETVPKFLDYVMYPTVRKDAYPSKLWSYTGSIGAGGRYISGSRPNIIEFQKNLNQFFRNEKQSPLMDVTIGTQNSELYQPEKWVLPPIIIFLPIILFIWENNRYLRILVEEKKSQLKIYLQVMGFRQYQLKLAGFILPLIIHIVTITASTIFLYIPLKDGSHVLRFVQPEIMICHLVLSAVNLTNFQCFLSVWFTNESYASAVSFVLLIIPPATLFGSMSSYPNISIHLSRLFCLIPSLCLTKGFIFLLDFEYYGKSVKILEKLSPESIPSLTVADYIIMNIVGFFFYLLLGIYLEKIIPGNYGITLPYYFFLKKSYWKPRRGSTTELEGEDITQQNQDNFEKVPPNLKVAITVKNLTKKYQNGVVALDNVEINFYEGEIIGLLGHNGAGKTTLFSILCGMTKATKGEVNVQGYDIQDSDNRKNLGYCPQYDILLNATVLQNIVFFGMAKGLSRKEARKEAKRIISRLGMEQSTNVRAPKLSGGQKRKLSLAVALSGNPQIILLDEPTTGIDSAMRRQIWNIILEMRGSKTVILCTHLLEEADVLCNRVAVLSQGKVQCFGSPMFLKSKYGTGFSLSIVAADISQASSITELVKKFVKTAEFKYQNILTLVFSLPEKELSNFPALFEVLDIRKNKKEITSYSVTVSTMEDAFLNTNAALKEKFQAQRNKNQRVNIEDGNDEYEKKKLKGILLFGYQMYALLIKKWIYLRRNFVAYLVTFVFFVLLHTTISSLMSSTGGENKIVPHSLDTYGKLEVLYMTNGVDKRDMVGSFNKVIVNAGATFRKVDNVTKELSKLLREDFTKFSKSILVIEFKEEEIEILYNSDAQFACPISIDLAFNALLFANDSFVKSALSYEYFKKSDESEDCVYIILNFILLLFLERYIFLMALLEERKTEVKPLQLLLVSPVSFWISHLIFDLPMIIIYAVICCTIMGFVNEDFGTLVLNNIHIFSINLLLYCIDILLLVYILSTVFDSYSSAVLFDILLTVASVLTFPSKEVFNITKYFSLTTLWFALNFRLCFPTLFPENSHMAFGIYGLVEFFILTLIDIGILRKIVHKTFTCLFYCVGIVRFNYEYAEDESVKNEKEIVEHLIKSKQIQTKMLVINNVKRWYCFCNCIKCRCCRLGCVKPAVKGVSFAVNKGECFGLVGTNGAGKTTIFGVLTGTLTPSIGSVYLESVDLFNCFLKHKTFFKMGFCPQFTAVLPKFKGREMLQLFGRLRGCSGSLLKKEVEKWIMQTNLQEYENKKCGNYSGGNKRKLAVGISLIGNPYVVLLDEPTSGIDVLSRRLIWDLISNFREIGRSVLLTSHSMEECEALCSRLTIMTKGQMRVIGEITTIKNIYGQGYTILLKLNVNATDEQRTDLHKAMENTFGDGCQLTDSHLTVLQYEIPKETSSWEKLFAELNKMKNKFPILESFLASSTTLEQIFMNLSKTD